jgi:autonomous glycyl radical cofactor GrcA
VSVTIGGSKKTAKTNATGEWKFTNVPPATYPLAVTLSGYATQTTSLTAAAGRTVVAVTLLA